MTPRQATQHSTDKKTDIQYLLLQKFKTKYYATFEKEVTDKNVIG